MTKSTLPRPVQMGLWGVAAAFLIGHLADHQRAASDLLADHVELLGAFLLCAFTGGLHEVTSLLTIDGSSAVPVSAGCVSF
jgi:hypothetical protein